MSINLHKFGIYPDDEDNHVFTFIFENPQRLLEAKSVESSEVNYAGHRWTVVCMRKEERYFGIFLKWKYTDGQSASCVSCKAKYSLTLIHRHDFHENKLFHSTQKFSSSQSLLGKSKLIPLADLLDQSAGFLDDTGKRIVLELSLSRCSTRFDKTIDTSPRNRTRKNASGFYHDTSTFLLANNRWFLRVYPQKMNSNGLPAVYLYLASKSKGFAMDMHFTLNLGQDSTEILTYHFGEGAKFDGFGKTLPEPLYKVEKINEMSIGVEISQLIIYKCAIVQMRPRGGYTPHVYKPYSSHSARSTTSSLTAPEAFQDHEGNYWKLDSVKGSKFLTLTFDKGVHHFPHNKTKLLCWSVTLLSRDLHQAQDIEMRGDPQVGYFSNFIDDKGYMVPLPIEMSEVEMDGSPYAGDDGELLLRVNFLSLQTIPIGMRSLPRFEYQVKHLLRSRQELKENTRSLDEMREMSASRASLSMLDGSRLPSESGDLADRSDSRMQMFKSYDSLDVFRFRRKMDISNSDVGPVTQDTSKTFCGDILRNLAEIASNGHTSHRYAVTERDVFNGTREDVSTESGVSMSDEGSLFMEARPSPVDLSKQREIVSAICKFLQHRLPVRVSSILETGSLGKGTATRSRMDVDLVVFSPDLPKSGQNMWMQPLLHACRNFLETASANGETFAPFAKCVDFHVTPVALQFTCGSLDVDVVISRDWDSDESGYDALYEFSCKENTPRTRQLLSFASAKLQKKFVHDQPSEVKELMKVLKHWRQCIQWKKASFRPNSYLLELLVIKAVEEIRHYDMKKVIEKVGSYVLCPELSITWSTFYNPGKYHVEFDPPTPLVRDPANPGVNVAESLNYWGEFRSEYSIWMKSLGIVLKSGS